jgi:hypothetical protein
MDPPANTSMEIGKGFVSPVTVTLTGTETYCKFVDSLKYTTPLRALQNAADSESVGTDVSQHFAKEFNLFFMYMFRRNLANLIASSFADAQLQNMPILFSHSMADLSKEYSALCEKSKNEGIGSNFFIIESFIFSLFESIQLVRLPETKETTTTTTTLAT